MSAWEKFHNRRKPWCVVGVFLCGLPALPAWTQQTLSLHEAIQKALRGPRSTMATEQVNAAQGLVRQSGPRPNPRLYLQSEDLRPWADDFSFETKTEDYAYVAQTIEIDGKRSKRQAFATANLHRSEDELRLRTQQIAGGVASAYWSAMVNERVATLLIQDLGTVDEMVRYHKERVDAGAMKGVDLIRIQIERDRIALSLSAANRDAVAAKIELYRQIGLPSDSNVHLADDIAAPEAPPAVDVETVLSQRADVAIARDQLVAAEADLKLQRSLAFPDPDLLGGYKRNSGDNTIFTALQIQLPFANRNQGEIQRADAQVRSARASLELAMLTVRADVAAAASNYRSEEEIVLHTLPEMRSRAGQNLSILTEAYRVGGVDLLRYIDAERTAIDVEVTALRTLAEYHQSALRLQLAYGGQP